MIDADVEKKWMVEGDEKCERVVGYLRTSCTNDERSKWNERKHGGYHDGTCDGHGVAFW